MAYCSNGRFWPKKNGATQKTLELKWFDFCVACGVSFHFFCIFRSSNASELIFSVDLIDLDHFARSCITKSRESRGTRRAVPCHSDSFNSHRSCVRFIEHRYTKHCKIFIRFWKLFGLLWKTPRAHANRRFFVPGVDRQLAHTQVDFYYSVWLDVHKPG